MLRTHGLIDSSKLLGGKRGFFIWQGGGSWAFVGILGGCSGFHLQDSKRIKRCYFGKDSKLQKTENPCLS